MPPIIAALQVPAQDDLVLSMIGVAQSIVPWSTLCSNTKANDAIGYLGSLLDALLSLAINHRRTVIRKDALRCLLHYACIVRSTNKRDLLHPYASNVIKTIGLALDDKKRSVRKEAVDCREQW
jgi:DNA repair/transcription protein MET18/MMS19